MKVYRSYIEMVAICCEFDSGSNDNQQLSVVMVALRMVSVDGR